MVTCGYQKGEKYFLVAKKYDIISLNFKFLVVMLTRGGIYMISSAKEYIDLFICEINAKIIPLAEILETDFSSGLQALASSGKYQRYWNSLMFFDEYLGRDKTIEIAQTYVEQFTDADRHLARQYLKGKNTLTNEHNLKYLIDNNLVDIKGLVEKRGIFSRLFGGKGASINQTKVIF